jgi:DnaJ-class molecular chaperone
VSDCTRCRGQGCFLVYDGTAEGHEEQCPDCGGEGTDPEPEPEPALRTLVQCGDCAAHGCPEPACEDCAGSGEVEVTP